MEPGQYDPAVESKKLRDDSKDGNREETESDQVRLFKKTSVTFIIDAFLTDILEIKQHIYNNCIHQHYRIFFISSFGATMRSISSCLFKVMQRIFPVWLFPLS